MNSKYRLLLAFVLTPLLHFALMGCEKVAHEPPKNSALVVRPSPFSEMFSSLEPASVMERIFDHPEPMGDGFMAWIPSYQESMDFNVSYDQRCHTRHDTTFRWRDSFAERALMLFSTEHRAPIDGDSTRHESVDCHFCGAMLGAALFHRADDHGWEIDALEKALVPLGIYGVLIKEGEMGVGFELMEIGAGNHALLVRDAVSGLSGEYAGSSYLVALEGNTNAGCQADPLRLLLKFEHYKEIQKYASDPVQAQTQVLKPIKLPEQAYWDLELTMEDAGKISRQQYVFDCDAGKYRRSSSPTTSAGHGTNQ